LPIPQFSLSFTALFVTINQKSRVQTVVRGSVQRNQIKIEKIVALIFGLAASINSFGCSSRAAPLTITMYHPETQQTLSCAARDELARSDPKVLAGAVESCAKNLEARGFVRK
jgi:hypothetical protein